MKALGGLGFKEIEVVVVNLTLEKEKILSLALNSIHGDWNYNQLAAILDEIMKVPEQCGGGSLRPPPQPP